MPINLHLTIPVNTTEEIDAFIEQLIEMTDKSQTVKKIIIEKTDSDIPVVQILIKDISQE